MLVRWHHRHVAICHGLNNNFVFAKCGVCNSDDRNFDFFVCK